jgi:pyruvate dehydrogenase E1 component alpha subunit
MFEEYNPLNKKKFQVINNEGKIINEKYLPGISDNDLLKAYKDMLFARTADLMTISYQRQGRIFTYPPNYGQEAISGAFGQVMKNDDWIVPAFREMGAYLAKGATLKEIFLYFMGYEDGNVFKNAINFMPISVPIASQLTHAAGIGYEIKYNKKTQVVVAFCGDGGTSEGDFHEALNFAGVWGIPVIFVIQNNQYGISTPFKIQTNSDGIAIKSVAYGIKGIQVDGNDFLAMYKVAQESISYARKENKPVLIEAVTYRKGAHTTSDDPTKYRTKEEEEQWDKTDPIDRLRKYLISKNLWTQDEEDKIVPDFKKEIDRLFIEAENYGDYKVDDIFDHLYSEIPDDLKKQKEEYKNFLTWKEKFEVKSEK